MIDIRVGPPSVAPNDSIKFMIVTQDDELVNASHVDIKADAVGQIRGYGFLWFTVQRIEKGKFAGEVQVPTGSRHGLREISLLTFVVEGKLFYRHPSRDFAPSFFEIVTLASTTRTPLELENQAKQLMQEREREFFSGFGRTAESNKKCQVFFFYKNIYPRGGDLLLRNIRVFRMKGLGGSDVRALINLFFAEKFGATNEVLQDTEQIRLAYESATPCICIWFPNVRAEKPSGAFESVMRHAETLSLLLSTDTNSSPQFLAAGIFDEDRIAEWVFDIPRYVGNWVAPFGPLDCFFNKQFELLEQRSSIRFYFTLYRDACSENNPDIAYFRYWTLLESAALGKGLAQKINGVRKLLGEHARKYGVDFGPVVNGEKFSAERCIQVWYARRNMTAHFGAFDPSSLEQKRHKKDFETCWSSLGEIKRMGHDHYLDSLRSTAKIVVQAMLS